MTKISNQYSLTNILTADLANSRLGINNVSPTVALDVTGAGKFSSSVTSDDLILTAGTLFGTGNTGFSNRLSDTTLYLQMPATGFNITDNALNTRFILSSAGIATFTGAKIQPNQTEIFPTAGASNRAYAFNVCNVAAGDFTISQGSTATGGTYTTRLTINPAGNVGIGTSSPDQQLTIGGYATIQMTLRSSTTTGSGEIYFGDSDSVNRGFMGYFHNGDYMQFNTAGSERMRITSGGDLLINTTASHGKLTVNGTIITIGSIGDNALLSRASSKAFGWFNDGTSLLLTYSGVANVGSFNMSTGGYTATSDINKKKDFEESNIGLNEVLNIKPILYRMKTEDESSSKHLGFIAQEVKNYIPQAYTESGEFIGLTEMPIIAALTKAIQELSAKVSLLENK
jgi:hypothetical protein